MMVAPHIKVLNTGGRVVDEQRHHPWPVSSSRRVRNRREIRKKARRLPAQPDRRFALLDGLCIHVLGGNQEENVMKRGAGKPRLNCERRLGVGATSDHMLGFSVSAP